MRARDLAQYIYDKSKEMNISLDELKLQKLLYYVQGYSFKELLEPAFEDEFVHWENGPVLENIHFEFKNDTLCDKEPSNNISGPLGKLTNDILKATKNLSSKELAEMTHKEKPWLNNNGSIPKEDIKDYFSRNDPLKLSCYDSSRYSFGSSEESEKIYEKITNEHAKLYRDLAKL